MWRSGERYGIRIYGRFKIGERGERVGSKVKENEISFCRRLKVWRLEEKIREFFFEVVKKRGRARR